MPSLDQPVQRPPLFTIILLASGAILSLNLFLPSLPDMAKEFQVSDGIMNLSFSGYLLGTAFLQLLVGPLSDRFGRRPVALISMSIFAAASIVTVFAPSIGVFLTFRFIQGAAIAGLVVTTAVIRDTSQDAAESASRLAIVTMIVSIGPLVGPLLGGMLSDLFGWRSNFIFLAALGFVVVPVCWLSLRETNLNKSSDMTTQFRQYPSLLGSFKFWAFASNIALMAGMFYAFLVTLPVVGADQFGWSKTQIGIMMAVLPIGYIVGNAVVGTLSNKLGILPLILLGRLVAILSPSICLILLLAGVSNPWLICGPLVLTGLGNGLSIPTSNAGAISVNPKIAGSAAGLSGAMVQFAGAGVGALAGAIVVVTSTAMAMMTLLLAIAIVGIVPTAIIWWFERTANRMGPTAANEEQ